MGWLRFPFTSYGRLIAGAHAVFFARKCYLAQQRACVSESDDNCVALGYSFELGDLQTCF